MADAPYAYSELELLHVEEVLHEHIDGGCHIVVMFVVWLWWVSSRHVVWHATARHKAM